MIADTGTSLLTSPSNKFNKIMDSIPVEDSCVGLKELPTLTFVVDGINYELNSEDYVISDEDSESTYSSEAKAEMLEMGGYNDEIE